jgi:carboxyl-terminal processing protease
MPLKSLNKSHVTRIILNVIFTFLFCCIASSSPMEKPMSEHWRETNLSFEWLTKRGFADHECVLSEKMYLGCVHAIDKLLSMARLADTNFTYSLSSEVHEIKHDVIHDFGVLFIKRESKKTNDKYKPTIFSSYEWIQDDLERTRWRDSSWLKLYRSGKDIQLPVRKILELFKRKIDPSLYANLVGEMFNQILKSVYDPHTYIRPTSYLEEMKDNQTQFYGVGILTREHPLGSYILSTHPKGGAHLAGIKPHDLITQVDTVSIAGLTQSEVTRLIRGKQENSILTMNVLRQNSELSFIVRRNKVNVVNFVYENFLHIEDKKSSAYGYMKIRHFMVNDLCRTFFKYLRKIEIDESFNGVFIDLRNNPGGDLDKVQCLLSQLIPEKKLLLSLQHLGSKKKNTEILSEGAEKQLFKKSFQFTKEIVVLVNGVSASASEIFAGVLQDYKRGTIVGERTFGKGTMQTVIQMSELKNISMAKTTARFHLPSGRTNQIHGITPDIQLKDWDLLYQLHTDKYFRESDLYINSVTTIAEPEEVMDFKKVRINTCIKNYFSGLEVNKVLKLPMTRVVDDEELDPVLMLSQVTMNCLVKYKGTPQTNN